MSFSTFHIAAIQLTEQRDASSTTTATHISGVVTESGGQRIEDGLPIEMYPTPLDWIYDMAAAGAYVLALGAVIALVGLCVGVIAGLW